MEIEVLRKLEGKRVRIILKNNFTYSYVILEITKDNFVSFVDKFGENLIIDPDYISAVSEVRE